MRYFGSALKRKGGFSEPPPHKTILLKELIFRDFVSPGELKFTVQAHGISVKTLSAVVSLLFFQIFKGRIDDASQLERRRISSLGTSIAKGSIVSF